MTLVYTSLTNQSVVVDPAARDYILNTIINNYSPTSTVLISTHLISDIEPILDEIIFLKDGKVVRQGNVDDIRYESGESIDQLFRHEIQSLVKGDCYVLEFSSL